MGTFIIILIIWALAHFVYHGILFPYVDDYLIEELKKDQADRELAKDLAEASKNDIPPNQKVHTIIEVKPPNIVKTDNNTYTIFTAGSIEMGKAIDWQTLTINSIRETKPELDVVIYNPRRDNWDANWVQSIDNKQFSEQVEWELDHIEKSDLIVMYLQPGTMSPISMLELGLVAERVFCMKKDMIVLCPEGFYRKGNIDIVCQYYDITMASDMDDLIEKIKEKIQNAPADKKAKQYFDSLYEDTILEE